MNSFKKFKHIINIFGLLTKVVLGFIIIFTIHLPKLIYNFLLVSFYKALPNKQNLTGNPKEHLNRAKKLLNKKRNDLILYAALEIRFALERMVQQQIIFAENVSKKMLKEYNPIKKRKFISILDKNADFSHKIIFRNNKSGETIEWGQYTPIDQEKVNLIKGKLGDLLHPKVGLNLGISSDSWYKETYNFLHDSIKYLEKLNKNNLNYFSYKDIGQFELIKIE